MIARDTYRLFQFRTLYFICPPIIGIIIVLISYPKGLLEPDILLFVLVYSYAMGLPFIKSFEFVDFKLEQKIPWLKAPFKRLILTIVLDVVVCSLVLVIINYIYFILIQGLDVKEFMQKTSEGIRWALFFTIAGIAVTNGVFFFKSWKQSAINIEKLKQEKLLAEYEALKNQVNPHFLFNNLSVLTFLVYKNQEKAVEFINQFSNVYRYVLDVQGKEVSDLATELKLLSSISFLYNMRFNDEIHIDIRLGNDSEKYVVPMALQMILENAIKHNEHSLEKPLDVHIFEEEDYIIVKNNLQKKDTVIDSNKVGLENIKLRYRYLTDKEVIIENDGKNYSVRIPVFSEKDD